MNFYGFPNHVAAKHNILPLCTEEKSHKFQMNRNIDRFRLDRGTKRRINVITKKTAVIAVSV